MATFNACVSRAENYAGPPAILPISYHERILALHGDIGARAMLDQPALPRPEEVVNPRARFDLDCSNDVRVAAAWVARRSA